MTDNVGLAFQAKSMVRRLESGIFFLLLSYFVFFDTPFFGHFDELRGIFIQR